MVQVIEEVGKIQVARVVTKGVAYGGEIDKTWNRRSSAFHRRSWVADNSGFPMGLGIKEANIGRR